MEDMWKVCDLNWSPQCKTVITAVVVNLISCIWMVRNQARFNNKNINMKLAISIIIANISLSGNNTKKVSFNSKRDYIILKTFKVTIHRPNVPIIKEIIWDPSLQNWTKCNIDGACSLGKASCSDIFGHNSCSAFLSLYVTFLLILLNCMVQKSYINNLLVELKKLMVGN
jgi:hypothetical protein